MPMQTSPTVAAVIVMLSASLGALTWVLLSTNRGHRRQIRANLLRPTRAGTPAPGSSTRQTATAADSRLATLGRRLMPTGYLHWLDGLIQRAGRPAAWPLARVLTVKVVGLLAGLALAATLASSLPGTFGKVVAGLALGLLAMAPDLMLYSRGSERSQAIQQELPDLLDQMSIAVEAGLGFDAAMQRVVRTSHTVIAQEFTQTLHEIQVGQTRRVAYEDLNERTRCDDLKRFTRSIIQAETYGLAMSEVLRTQAGEMRLKRRQRAEEKAMQIPVKVTIPLMLFILPVLFIVVLGPVALHLVA